jgi:hypothetical protein
MGARLAAGLALAVFLFILFRFAMGLRASRLAREEARRAEEARGRRVVAEVPGADGALRLFLEDAHGFYFPGLELAKARVSGARLRLNGAVVSVAARKGVVLPAPSLEDVDVEGRERWDVEVHLSGGAPATIHCGSLREGVSRETAAAVFDAVRGAIEGR